MNCPYCNASNAEDDHRCNRCGRRVEIETRSTRRNNNAEYQHSAAAPALDFEPELSASDRDTNLLGGAGPRRPVYQPSLFTSSRVVAFESFAPESVDAPGPKAARPRQKVRRLQPGQQSFGFEPDSKHHQPSYERPAQPMEPMIGCDAPVAVTAHRMIAAALDISMVIIALSMFSLIFRLAGGAIILNKHTAPLIVGIICITFLLYKLIWCYADGDTAGMRWARLRLVDFDGNRPEREQRLFRMAAGFLSLLAAGLGLLWALVDEESLTWHDHISKTFPTPY